MLWCSTLFASQPPPPVAWSVELIHEAFKQEKVYIQNIHKTQSIQMIKNNVSDHNFRNLQCKKADKRNLLLKGFVCCSIEVLYMPYLKFEDNQ